VAEFATQFSVRNELKKRVFRRFRQDRIEIPLPTRVVHLETLQELVEKPPPPSKL
jgi:small-conductance mechanosensitive channel